MEVNIIIEALTERVKYLKEMNKLLAKELEDLRRENASKSEG